MFERTLESVRSVAKRIFQSGVARGSGLPAENGLAPEERFRRKYLTFRELLELNNECLELMAGLQDDLQYVHPQRDIIGGRVGAIFEKACAIITALESLTGLRYAQLNAALEEQRTDVERQIAAYQEMLTPRLAAWLTEFGMEAVSEIGGKAAALGEVKNKIGLPVPNGYALTTAAYRQFCGVPLWEAIRDAIRNTDPADLSALQEASARLRDLVMRAPLPRAIEVAISERANRLQTAGCGLAVRSSAVGEGGEKTFAGQYLTLLNVPPEGVVDAYRRVIAERFSLRALSYRLSTGLLEVDSPMAVLVLPIIAARAAGILYTRDPGNPKSRELWVTATRGLAVDIAGGGTPADLFIVSRSRPHRVLDQHIVAKETEIVGEVGGGLVHRTLDASEGEAPSLSPTHLHTLADWALRIEGHFKTPQDIEWALDQDGKFWILQARPLAVVAVQRSRKVRARVAPVLTGGRTVFPGQVSGSAYLIPDVRDLSKTPEGSIVFLRRASPEIVAVLPRIAGLVAEWGNVAGHAAALLREFKVPSVFLMKGCFDAIRDGDPVSLDSVQARLYPGKLWEPRRVENGAPDKQRAKAGDAVSSRVLALNLLDPSGGNFRPSGCKSAHDVLRFCHEKAVEAMFAVNDLELEQHVGRCKKLDTKVPMNVYVLDLGAGLSPGSHSAAKVTPGQIVSRPFQSLWGGLSDPSVSWKREMPASLSDLASVLSGSFTTHQSSTRSFGEISYLLVADEYMNLNSRLAYHFSLVDACLSDSPSMNYISFRFAGGGATRQRRGLRTCFLDACLTHYGFRVDRRGDLLNAWYKRWPADQTSERLNVLGRLLACSSQLDMYMSSHEIMKWYTDQFIAGNYQFHSEDSE